MAVKLEELQIHFSAEMGSLSSQLNGVKKQLTGVSSSAGVAQKMMTSLARTAKLFLGVYLVRGLYNIGKQSLQMANDVVESESLFSVSMKGMADEARAWSDELSSSLGINAYEARKNVGTFNTMFRSMGMSTDKAYEMSTGLTQLAYDMGSFYNVDTEEMFDKLRAGITGETEPLKRLGIMVDENTTKQYAMAEGISATGKELTQSEKLLARYAAIMGQTADAQGDLARTINSPVNQIRLLNNTLNQAKITLGQAFQPIQAIVLPILHSLAQAALTAANALKTFLWALTGFTGIGNAAALTAGAGADANADLADGLKDTAKAYKAAGGAAKKAAKDANVGLKAFDEINKLSEEEAEKLGGGGAGLGEIPEVIEPEQNKLLETFNTYMSEAADWLKKVWELAQPTRDALGRLWEQLQKFGSLVWDRLVWFYDNFLVPIGKWAVTRALPAFLDLVSSGVRVLNSVIEAAGPWLQNFYDRILVPFGNWAGDAIIDALQWLTDKFDALAKWISENQATFNLLSDALFSIFAAILVVHSVSSLITAVKTGFELLHGAIALFTSPKGVIGLLIAGLILLIMHWDEVKKWAVDAWEKIKQAWWNASVWYNETVVKPVVAWFKQAWEDIKGFFVGAWASITGLWSTVSTWFNNAVVQPVVNWFKQAWEDIKGFFSGAWAVITGLWSTVSTWFYNSVVKPIIDWFASIGIDLPGIFSSAWAFIQSIWVSASTWFYNTVIKPVQDAFNTAINTIRGWWNGLLNLFGLGASTDVTVNKYENTYKKQIVTRVYKDAVGNETEVEMAGQGSGFAAGGVFPPNRPFLGVLGDQSSGMNIETPENLLRQVVREESGGAASYNSAGMIQQAVEAVLDKLQITLNVDGQTFGKASIRAINTVQRNAGTVLFQM